MDKNTFIDLCIAISCYAFSFILWIQYFKSDLKSKIFDFIICFIILFSVLNFGIAINILAIFIITAVIVVGYWIHFFILKLIKWIKANKSFDYYLDFSKLEFDLPIRTEKSNNEETNKTIDTSNEYIIIDTLVENSEPIITTDNETDNSNIDLEEKEIIEIDALTQPSKSSNDVCSENERVVNESIIINDLTENNQPEAITFFEPENSDFDLEDIEIDEIENNVIEDKKEFILPNVIQNKNHQKKKIERKNKTTDTIIFIDKEDKEQQAIRNKEIGNLGEEYVLWYEEQFLISKEMDEFIPKIKHLSKEYDGYGYDIVSFDENGKEKYIEVKTTVQNKLTDFYMTSNELETMLKTENYFIYRLFNFDEKNLKGDLLIIDCKKEFKSDFILSAESFKISKK